MARCGCTGTTCSCKIIGESGIIVRGAGTITNPYVISGGLAQVVQDTATVNLTLLGSGSQADPYVLSADATLRFGDLIDVVTSGGSTGYVPALQADGTYALVPPSTAAAGTISTGLALDGDGSSGDPLNVRLGSLSGLVIRADGLAVEAYTVTTEADLSTLYGALPEGSIVSMEDGSAVWVKSTSGWAEVVSDTGLVSTVSGNVSSATGWTVNSVWMRRRNGVVTFRLTITNLVNRSTLNDSGNIANLLMATLLNTDFRPCIESPIRILSAGSDHSVYVATNGNIYMSNFAQGDVTFPAGEVHTFAGTWLGV